MINIQQFTLEVLQRIQIRPQARRRDNDLQHLVYQCISHIVRLLRLIRIRLCRD